MALPTQPITGSVGIGGANRSADVRCVQTLLNAVPSFRGGPLSALSVDGACGPLTCGAIKRFQSGNGCYADGRIDVGGKTQQVLLQMLSTLGVLASLLGGAAPAAPNGGAGGAVGPLSPLRTGIKKWGLIGANGPYGDVGGSAPKGIVSDLDTTTETLSWGGQRTIRKGWRNYKAFFDEAVAGWTEGHWKAPGYLDGVKVPGKRVPQGGGRGVSWCGIFATWCWVKAGKQTEWIVGVGPSLSQRVAGNEGIQVGDICVQKGAEVHHFLAIGIEGDVIQGVNGNSDFQSILVKPMQRSTVQYHYRPE